MNLNQTLKEIKNLDLSTAVQENGIPTKIVKKMLKYSQILLLTNALKAEFFPRALKMLT